MIDPVCSLGGQLKGVIENLRTRADASLAGSRTWPILKKKEAPVAQIDQGSFVFPLNVVTNQPSQ